MRVKKLSHYVGLIIKKWSHFHNNMTTPSYWTIAVTRAVRDRRMSLTLTFTTQNVYFKFLSLVSTYILPKILVQIFVFESLNRRWRQIALLV